MIEIFIITYNRAKFLRKTLMYLKNSKLTNYKVTILNNCSTDNTITSFEEFKNEYGSSFQNLKMITHFFNLGANVNIMKAIELSKSKFTWILCDDDIIDASDIDDVFEILNQDEVDIVHVGAHPEKERKIFGEKENVKTLLNKGYPYFAYSSFLPCNIFRTELFQKEFFIKGYNNVVNSYPHMPYLFDVYLKNKDVYISKNQIVTARIEGQCYNQNQWVVWWINTCKLLEIKGDVRLAFFDQFKIMGNLYNTHFMNSVYSYLITFESENSITSKVVKDFINDYFEINEKIKLNNIKKNSFINVLKSKIYLYFFSIINLKK
jgi:glycosyltransferase involved in cell wall biosynthesis